MSPLDVIVTWLPVIGRAGVSMRKIDDLGLSLDAGGADVLPAPEISLSNFQSIQLNGVQYTYFHGDEHEFTLGPVDLELVPGEIVFLVGGNGSGKTTLVKLLAGLYHPEAGEVLIDDRPVIPELLEAYRGSSRSRTLTGTCSTP